MEKTLSAVSDQDVVVGRPHLCTRWVVGGVGGDAVDGAVPAGDEDHGAVGDGEQLVGVAVCAVVRVVCEGRGGVG